MTFIREEDSNGTTARKHKEVPGIRVIMSLASSKMEMVRTEHEHDRKGMIPARCLELFNPTS